MIMPWEKAGMKNKCDGCKHVVQTGVDELGISCEVVYGYCFEGSEWEPNDEVAARLKASEAKHDSEIKDSGNRTIFTTGAVRDMHQGKGRCDLLPPLALLRLAKHFEAGAIKHGDRNWEKGIPCHSFLDSALRHIFKYMAGYTDEDHLIAALWNIACLAETEEIRFDVMDIPARMEEIK